MSTLKSTDTVN